MLSVLLALATFPEPDLPACLPALTPSRCPAVNIRLEEHNLCLLVMIGVRAGGRKELIALADGFRESAESWSDLLRNWKRRGMRAPVLAVGDGALAF